MPGLILNRMAISKIRPFLWTIIAAIFTLSCSFLFSSGLPDEQSSADPLSAASPEVYQSPTPPADPKDESGVGGNDPMLAWPLVSGNSWTYEVDVYSEALTATYILTDTVVAVLSKDDVHLAQVERDAKLVAGDSAVTLIWFENAVRWYVVLGNQVFKPQSDTFAEIEKAWLEYVFPLSESCWHPDYESRAQPGLVECNKFGSETEDVTVAAGTFTNCDLVIEQYLSGGVVTTFCSGIGIVAEDYDHMGSPFGYHAQLIAYRVSLE